MPSSPVIEIIHLKNYMSGQWVHQDVNLTVNQGEILTIIGGSGSGKTTIFRSLLMLQEPTSGTLKIFGKNLSTLSENESNHLRQRWGVLFQHSALFSSMTLLENVMFPMQEFTQLPTEFLQTLALLKLNLVGLPLEAAHKYPAELSGGMQRRAAAARALAMEPELLFLDEPTTGLDPKSARQFNQLILYLRTVLNLTVLMISHDLESFRHADRIAFMGEGRVLAVAPLEELIKNPHPLIQEYFSKF